MLEPLTPVTAAGSDNARSTALERQIDLLVQSCQDAVRQAGDAGQAGAVRLRVVDLGGGTGSQAAGLAKQGHHVTVVDPSPNALAAVSRRAAEAGLDTLHAEQGDAENLADLLGIGTVDLVLCHNVLEVVDDPVVALGSVRQVLRADAPVTTAPGPAPPTGAASSSSPATPPPVSGRLSLLVANRNAAIVARVARGNLRQAHQMATDPSGSWGADDPLRRRFTPLEMAELLAKTGFAQRSVRGIHTLSDLAPYNPASEDSPDPALLEALDAYAASEPALLDISPTLLIDAVPIRP
ncbi:MAG: SAM-dependent methyltransferase [Micrococcales bacterium]|nr:MAG: SAM-dependent methyltransferase [Micrococcales bacterium]PIE27300.1 MAG: SAM-dependent methyltransferase [Micrococcales bacterium]